MDLVKLSLILNEREKWTQQVLEFILDDSGVELDVECLLIKTYNEHIRPTGYLENWVIHYSEEDFFRLFRFKRSTVEVIQNYLAPALQKPNLFGHEQISVERKVGVALTYLSTQQTLRQIGNTFDLCDSTVLKIVEEVCTELCYLAPRIIQWPSQPEAHVISVDYQEICGIPDVISSLDGCNIKGTVGPAHGNDYTDRKYNKSIILLAACTASKMITYISVGCPGRAHDSRAFQLSSLYHKIQTQGENAVFYDGMHLLWDAAFALRTHGLKPYQRHNGVQQDPAEAHFNRHLSVGRVRIEHCFGMLKGRWRRLKHVNVYKVHKISIITTAACVLHNICLINDDILPEALWEPIDQPEDPLLIDAGGNEVGLAGAVEKRDQIRDQLYQ